MADLLSRIVGPVNIANGTSTVFTGTALHTYTVKPGGIVIVNPTAATVTVKLGVGGVTDALLFAKAKIPAGGFYVHPGSLTLSGAETLQANASATGTTITMSGLDQS